MGTFSTTRRTSRHGRGVAQACLRQQRILTTRIFGDAALGVVCTTIRLHGFLLERSGSRGDRQGSEHHNGIKAS